jgi:hypothetical protein
MWSRTVMQEMSDSEFRLAGAVDIFPAGGSARSRPADGPAAGRSQLAGDTCASADYLTIFVF